MQRASSLGKIHLDEMYSRGTKALIRNNSTGMSSAVMDTSLSSNIKSAILDFFSFCKT